MSHLGLPPPNGLGLAVRSGELPTRRVRLPHPLPWLVVPALTALLTWGCTLSRLGPDRQLLERSLRPSVLRVDAISGTRTVSGTAFAVRDDRIVTRLSLLRAADRVVGHLWDGSELEAERVVSVDAAADLVVLGTSRADLRPLTIGDSAALALGERVFLVRAVPEDTSPLQEAVLIGRTVDPPPYRLQTSLEFRAESWGAPIVDVAGRVVGVALPRIPLPPAQPSAGDARELAPPSDVLVPLIAPTGAGAPLADFLRDWESR